jgi:hypothetical protein
MATTRSNLHPICGVDDPRRSSVLTLPLLIAVLLLISSVATTAHGQDAPENGAAYSYPYAEETSPAVRDQLFAELARDVEALEQRLGIVKRVIQLVSPSVVHIQAKKNASYGNNYRGLD